jgi:hypothetical protein
MVRAFYLCNLLKNEKAPFLFAPPQRISIQPIRSDGRLADCEQTV